MARMTFFSAREVLPRERMDRAEGDGAMRKPRSAENRYEHQKTRSVRRRADEMSQSRPARGV